MPGDMVLDPFAGTGTTLCVSRGLSRYSIGVEKSAHHVEHINQRLSEWRPVDDVSQLRGDYEYTAGLDEIWGSMADAASAGLAGCHGAPSLAA